MSFVGCLLVSSPPQEEARRHMDFSQASVCWALGLRSPSLYLRAILIAVPLQRRCMGAIKASYSPKDTHKQMVIIHKRCHRGYFRGRNY